MINKIKKGGVNLAFFVAIGNVLCYYVLTLNQGSSKMIKKALTFIGKNKKWFIISAVVIALVAGGLCFIKPWQDDAGGEYKILELTEKTMPAEREFAVVDADGNVILTNADVNKVLVVFEKSKDRYLELRLTDEGAVKFKKAVNKKDAVLSMTLAGKTIASPVIADDAEENSAIVLGDYEDVMDWFNAIT